MKRKEESNEKKTSWLFNSLNLTLRKGHVEAAFSGVASSASLNILSQYLLYLFVSIFLQRDSIWYLGIGEIVKDVAKIPTIV